MLSSMLQGHLQSSGEKEEEKNEEQVATGEAVPLAGGDENDPEQTDTKEASGEIIVPDDDDDEDDHVLIKASTFEQKVGNATCCATKCCYLTIDIVMTVFSYIMSILFLFGGVFIHPRTYGTTMKEPLVFYFLAVVCYLTVSILDIVKRRTLGVLEIVMTSLSIVGGTIWFVSSIFLFMRLLRFRVWASLWIVGCIFNLVSITYDIVMELLKDAKPLFRTISLCLAWMANFLFIGASIQVLKEYSTLTTCEMGNAATGLASGGAVYFIHAIFHTLSFSLKSITFSIDKSP